MEKKTEQKTLTLTSGQNGRIVEIIVSTIPSIIENINMYGMSKTLEDYVHEEGYELKTKVRADKTIELSILKDGELVTKEFI